MTTTLDLSAVPQHFVMHGVSWSYYEHTLEEIDNHSARIAFLDGMMEIMSVTPEHEAAKKAIANLIPVISTERQIPRKSYGSATFRREEKRAGAEPDECYYFHDIDSVKGMKRFDPIVHRAPDLWVEVDLFNPSVPREPIYARLGVPEIWRYNGERIVVRLLTSSGVYSDAAASRAFPFLPMSEFTTFIPKMIDDDETRVTIEFREWVRSLPLM